MAISKINLTDADRGLLESSVRLRIHSIELRWKEADEKYKQTKDESFHKWADYFRDELNQLRDLASKLYNSRSRGLIYEGEGTSEHVK